MGRGVRAGIEGIKAGISWEAGNRLGLTSRRHSCSGSCSV